MPAIALATAGGEGGIRTLDPVLRNNGFQDRRIRPLCHLSTRIASKRYMHAKVVLARYVRLYRQITVLATYHCFRCLLYEKQFVIL